MWGFCCSLAQCLHREPLLAQQSVLLSEHSVGNKCVSFKGCVEFCLPRIPISVCCPPQMYFVYIRRTEIRLYRRLNRHKHIKRDSKGCKLLRKNIKVHFRSLQGFSVPRLNKINQLLQLSCCAQHRYQKQSVGNPSLDGVGWGTNWRFCQEMKNKCPGILLAMEFQPGDLSQCSLGHCCTSALFKMQPPLKGRVNNWNYHSGFMCKSRQTSGSELNTSQSKD